MKQIPVITLSKESEQRMVEERNQLLHSIKELESLKSSLVSVWEQEIEWLLTNQKKMGSVLASWFATMADEDNYETASIQVYRATDTLFERLCEISDKLESYTSRLYYVNNMLWSLQQN